MNETLQILLIPVLLLLAGVGYIVPLAFPAAAAIRFVLRWYSDAKWLGGAVLAMLPQTLVVLVNPDLPDFAPYITLPLVFLGLGFYWRATRGYRALHILLEGAALSIALVYVLTGINWIVH